MQYCTFIPQNRPIRLRTRKEKKRKKKIQVNLNSANILNRLQCFIHLLVIKSNVWKIKKKPRPQKRRSSGDNSCLRMTVCSISLSRPVSVLIHLILNRKFELCSVPYHVPSQQQK